jgi:hypothetical protein
MLLSILYRFVRCLLGLNAVLAQQDLSKDAELLVLRQENTVLRRQGARMHSTPADRAWLATVSRLAPRRRWTEIVAGTPATIVAWHHTLVSRQGNDPPRRPSGRPPTAVAIKKSRDSQGSRESHLETPAGAGRTDPTRPSHRRLHRVADWTVLDLVDTGRGCR